MDDKKFRLYIDESGTHNYSSNDDIKHRYLGLTGVIISEKQNVEVLQPGLLAMKRMIASDLDELPILHQEDIVRKSGDFVKLNDPAIKKQFNDKLFELLDNMDFTICAVVLDKKSHLQTYQKSAYHPYHYCMNVLLERYVFCLQEKGGRGDVLAEARGKAEDQPLKEEYQHFYENGTYFCSKGYVQQFLTSKEIKIKPKNKMLAGLEFADLLSLATKLDTLHSHDKIPDLVENFCKEIVAKIQKNYRCPVGKRINGFGRKLIC